MSDVPPARSAPPAPPLLVAENLRKTYTLGASRLEVLRGVGFTLARGEFVALRGASGAGKSTLLHLLGGLDEPTSGSVYYAGRELTALGGPARAELRNRRLGHIFQAYHLLPELSALENVVLPARMARRPVAEALRAGRELLARVGLAARAEHRPLELSGGEQQRVAIARALVNRPELLLADEPTGNLDSHTGGEIIELLCALRTEHGAALVVATHDDAVAARAQRVVTLVDGLIKAGSEE